MEWLALILTALCALGVGIVVGRYLFNSMLKKEAETGAMSTIKLIVDEAKTRANKEAKKVIIESIQRTASEQTIENTVSVYNLERDDSKGQIIGREGRNIRALESATMASELGLNTKLAKRAGLLHDIGKVPEDEPERSHAILGMKLAEKYGEHEAVCNAIGAHHDEVEMKFAISPVVQACDAISGARPGARRETAERYVQRLKDLEDLAVSFEGVVKAYAIQAGRELRIMLESEKVSDKTADEISFNVSQRIQDEMQYPGQVKVTVIRERRAISYAK